MRRLFRECAGSVLMEYVIVCCGIAVFILLAMQTTGAYTPIGEKDPVSLWGFYNAKDGFIGLGEELKIATQQVLGGISLPVP